MAQAINTVIEGIEESDMTNKAAGRMKILSNPLFTRNESKKVSAMTENREGALQLLRKGKFRDRYVIVNSQNMYVYKKRDRKVLKSQWNLAGCSLQRLPAQKHRMSGQRLDFRFDITMTTGDTLNFAAGTDQERRDWCEFLERLGESDAQRQAVHENSIVHSVIPGVGDVSISCDVFQTSANLGFLRCGYCGVRQALHFSPTDVHIDLPGAEYAGWLNVRKRHRSNFLVSENKRRYLRLKGFQLSWSHDPKITDANVYIFLDLRCQLMQYDKKAHMFSSSFDFSLKTAKDKYSFSASTEDERNTWMDKIHKLLVIAYQLQEARITSMASTIAGMEASHVFDATELWRQRQVLQVLEERARPFPAISQETDSQTEKIYQSAAKLANGEDKDIIDFIEKDGVAKLSNTLRRLGNQDHLSEDEVELVDSVIQCFRAIMNKPVGMEAIILDTTPIVLLSRIVFLSQSTPGSSLLMSVCGILSATSIFSMDGYDLVVRTLRTMDRAFHRLLDRGEVQWNDFCILEEIPRLRPFIAIIKLLENISLPVQAVIILLALINTVITSPNTRHERLRIRAELFSQGLDQTLMQLIERANQTIFAITGARRALSRAETGIEPTEISTPTSEATEDALPAKQAPTTKRQTVSTMDFLMSRRMGEGGGMSAGFGTTDAGSVVQDGQAVMKSDKAPSADAKQRFQRIHDSLNKSFDLDDSSHNLNAKAKGRASVPEANLLSVGNHSQPANATGQPTTMRNLVQVEVEMWEQVKHLIEMYKELGEEDAVQDEVDYDGGNLTNVLFTIDRISLQRKMEIREQAVLVLNQLLLGLKDTDIEDQLLKVEGFTFKGIKFSNEMNAAKFHMRKQLEDRGIRAFESSLGDTALQRARRQAENFSDRSREEKLSDSDSSGPKSGPVKLLSSETRSEPQKTMLDMVQSSLAQQPIVAHEKPQAAVQSMPPLPPPIPIAAKAIPLVHNAPNLAAALSSAAANPTSKSEAASGAVSSLLSNASATTASTTPSVASETSDSATASAAVTTTGPSPPPPPSPGMLPPMPGAKGPRGLPPPKGALGSAPQVQYNGPKPTQKMKGVHWEKVPNQLAATSWWTTEPSAEFSAKEIDDLDISPNLVESLFAAVQTEDDKKKAAKAEADAKGTSSESTTPAVNDGIQLLQGPRTQNLAITRNRLGLSIAQIRQVLLTCNIGQLNERQIDLLPLLLPDSEEERALQAYLDGCGDPEKLREQERFLVSMVNIPRVRNKISVCMCLTYMDQKIREATAHIGIMEQACHQAEHSKCLRALLKLTLKLGNFMNFGSNRMVDSTMGVRVRSIEQLGSVRSAGTLNDGSEDGASNAKSVLHYMARLCAAQAPFVLKIKEELSVMGEAAGIEHDAVAEQMNEIIVQTRHALKETEHEESRLADDIKQWADVVNDLAEKFRDAEAHAANVLRIYGEDPVKTPYSDWFGMVGRVAGNFDKAVTENNDEDEKRERRLRVEEAKKDRQNVIESRKQQEKKIMEEHQQRQLKKQQEKEQKLLEEKLGPAADAVGQHLDEIGMVRPEGGRNRPTAKNPTLKKKWTLRASLRLNKPPPSETQSEVSAESSQLAPSFTTSVAAGEGSSSESDKMADSKTSSTHPIAPVTKPPPWSVGQMPNVLPPMSPDMSNSEPDFSDRGRTFRKTLSRKFNINDMMAEMAGTEVMKQLGLSGTGVCALKPGWSIQMAQAMGSQAPIAESALASTTANAESDDEDEV